MRERPGRIATSAYFWEVELWLRDDRELSEYWLGTNRQRLWATVSYELLWSCIMENYVNYNCIVGCLSELREQHFSNWGVGRKKGAARALRVLRYFSSRWYWEKRIFVVWLSMWNRNCTTEYIVVIFKNV